MSLSLPRSLRGIRNNASSASSSWNWVALWRWERDGLLGWLPVRVRNKLLGSYRELVVKPDSEGVTLLRRDSKVELLTRETWKTLDREVLRRWLRAERPTAIILQIPADRALTRQINLPLAVAPHLHQALGYDMDRLTPFSANQVYYDALIVERYPEQRRMRVEVVVTPRSEVDAMLEALAALGIVPDGVEAEGSRPGFNVLPVERRPRRDVWPRRLRTVLMVLSLSLVLITILWPLWQYRTRVIDLQNRVNALQRESNEVLTLRERLEKTVESSRFVLQKKQKNPPIIELLNELTLILPDHTWLERVHIKGDSLQLIGQSTSAAALVGILEEAKWLRDAAFASPITQDRRTNKERFVLGARIVAEPQ